MYVYMLLQRSGLTYDPFDRQMMWNNLPLLVTK